MEVSMEIEDDVFFADLSKQISLLIMDEEEDIEDPLAPCPSLSLQPCSGAIHPPPQTSFFYENAYRRESKGTGVFIPQSTQPKRKKQRRQARFPNSYNKKNNRQLSQDTRMVSQVSNDRSSFKHAKG